MSDRKDKKQKVSGDIEVGSEDKNVSKHKKPEDKRDQSKTQEVPPVQQSKPKSNWGIAGKVLGGVGLLGAGAAMALAGVYAKDGCQGKSNATGGGTARPSAHKGNVQESPSYSSLSPRVRRAYWNAVKDKDIKKAQDRALWKQYVSNPDAEDISKKADELSKYNLKLEELVIEVGQKLHKDSTVVTLEGLKNSVESYKAVSEIGNLNQRLYGKELSNKEEEYLYNNPRLARNNLVRLQAKAYTQGLCKEGVRKAPSVGYKRSRSSRSHQRRHRNEGSDETPRVTPSIGTLDYGKNANTGAEKEKTKVPTGKPGKESGNPML